MAVKSSIRDQLCNVAKYILTESACTEIDEQKADRDQLILHLHLHLHLTAYMDLRVILHT